MKSTRRFLLLMLTSLLAMALACNLVPSTINPNTASTGAAGTIKVQDTSTAAVLAAAGTMAAGSGTPIAPAETIPAASASVTPSGTPAASATSESTMANLTENTNCRSGPLALYDLIRTFLSGDSAEILGKNAAGDYWYVRDSDQPGKDCWLWGRYVQVSGDTANLPVFTPPPTPTPGFDWSGDWYAWVDGDPAQMSLSQSGSAVSGTLYDPDDSFSLVGATSDGGRSLSGEVTDLDPPVTFVFRMTDDLEHFQGHYVRDGTTYPWCGSRSNSQPSPCLWP